MLEFYLDDSGTHNGSPVLVWGGVAGDKIYLDQLDREWRELLISPCDGKLPIKTFHSYDLENGVGEFAGYNRAERDLTRRNFRQAIVRSSVSVFAYGISVEDWDQVVHVLAQWPDFTAEQAVFGKAVEAAAKTAKINNEALNLQFDAGRDSADLRKLVESIGMKAIGEGRLLSYSFSPVSAVPALQAADLVVHEAFGLLCQFTRSKKAMPRAHAQRLFDDPFAGVVGWLGRREIRKAVEQVKRKATLSKKSGR